MAVNKRKILEAARKHAQRGSKQKALKEYAALLRVDASDARLRLEVGDAHRRWGQIDEAIVQYTRVAEQYCEEGFDARAVAVYKQILNLAPKRYAAHVSVADLYKRMGLEAEAVNALQAAADGYHREGEQAKVLELLRKLAQLDPGNTMSRLRVAAMLAAEGHETEAVEEYQGVARELIARSERDPAQEVLERAVALAPQDAEVLVALAANARECGAFESAADWANRALAVEEAELALDVLCDAYRALDETDRLTDATRRLAKCLRDRGDEAAARSIMQRLPHGAAVDADGESPEADPFGAKDGSGGLELELELEPAAPEDGLQDAVHSPGDEPSGVLHGPGAGESAESAQSVDAAMLVDVDIAVEPLAENGAMSALLTAPQSDPARSGERDLEQLLADATVYLRYGKAEEALAALRTLLVDEPGHRVALERLGQALVASGDEPGAIEAWVDGCERAREEDAFEHFEALRSQIAEIDPVRAAAVVPMAPALGDASGEERPAGPEDEIEFEICDADLLQDLAAAGEPADASATAIHASSATAEQVRGQLAAAEELFERGVLDHAAEAYRQVLAVAPNHPSALVRLGEIENDAVLPVRAEADLLSTPAASAWAEDTLPMGNPQAAGQEHADDSFDLAAALSGDMDGVEPPLVEGASAAASEEDFTSLFDSFKRGVSETLADGDYETRYDLAIAYKEMGLLEDAIASFESCVACPARGLDSLQLLAQCSIEIGRPADAIHHLEQALSGGDDLEPQRRAGLYFDLARAFNASGDPERARSTYETVSELAPSFPGLSEAIAVLLEAGIACGVDPEAAGEADRVDGFERLDDILAEATARDAIEGVTRRQASDGVEPVATNQGSEPGDEKPGDRERPRKRRKKITFV